MGATSTNPAGVGCVVLAQTETALAEVMHNIAADEWSPTTTLPQIAATKVAGMEVLSPSRVKKDSTPKKREHPLVTHINWPQVCDPPQTPHTALTLHSLSAPI
jgi:hypothetical protein